MIHPPTLIGCSLVLLLAAAAAAPPSAAIIVTNERAFEQAAIERGSRAAFLEYLAADAALLEPLPVPGRATVEKGPSPGALLRWRPDLAAISSGGDFGWASGPFLAYAASVDELPVGSGHYFTGWQRDAAGAWRVLLDGGVAYPVGAAKAPTQLAVTPRLRAVASGTAKSAGCAAALAARWRSAGRGAALAEFLATDARLMSAGSPPLDGRSEILGHDPLAGAALGVARPLLSLAAPAGDLLISVGEYELEPLAGAAARHFVYIDAWDLGRSCRLALEALDPET